MKAGKTRNGPKAYLDDGADDDFGSDEREDTLVDPNLRYGLCRASRREAPDEVLHCERA